MRAAQILSATIVILATIKDVLFFSLSGFFGFQYTGSNESSAWMIFVAVSFVVTAAAFVAACVRKPSTVIIEVLLYAFVALLLLNHLVWWLSELTLAALIPLPFLHFIAFSIPGILALRILLAFDAWGTWVRIMHATSVIISIGIAVSVLLPFALGIGEVLVTSGLSMLGGANAQSASYFASFAFGLLGYYLFRADPALMLQTLSGPLARVLQLFLWGCMGLATIVNGGRGGLLLMLIYFFLHLYWMSVGAKITYQSLCKITALLLVLPPSLLTLYAHLESSEIFGIGFRRALDMFLVLNRNEVVSLADASSNRDQVLIVALEGIANAPLVGYGAFNHWSRVIQPHNFFLDLALQFGVPAAIILIVIGLTLMLLNLRPPSPERSFIIVLGLYPLTLVTFSSGYFLQPLLWVVVGGLVIPWRGQMRHFSAAGDVSVTLK